MIRNYPFPIGISGMREVTSLQILQTLKKIRVNKLFLFIKKKIREYYEQFHPSAFDNLEEMEKILGIYKLSKLTYEYIDN